MVFKLKWLDNEIMRKLENLVNREAGLQQIKLRLTALRCGKYKTLLIYSLYCIVVINVKTNAE